MTERKAIDQQARVAIWEVWGKRCFYTSDPIEYADLQIDHIIPVEGGDEIVATMRDNAFDRVVVIDPYEPTRAIEIETREVEAAAASASLDVSP